MAPMTSQMCKKCERVFPLTRKYFGNTNNNGKIGFRGSCRECMRKNSAQHHAGNPEQYAARVRLRSGRERENSSKIIDVAEAPLRSKLDDKCRYCEAALNGGGELDHLTPVARGGSGRPGNITLACRDCNRAKLAKTLDEFNAWRRQRGLVVRDVTIPGEAPDRPTTVEQRRDS